MGLLDLLFPPYTVTKDHAYGPHERQRLDLYTPKKVTDATRVVIFFFGGGFDEGDKSQYGPIADSFARAGYITIVPNYRLWNANNPTVHRWPTQIEDAERVVYWTRQSRKKSNGTPRPIFLVGHSAGGCIALHLNLDETWLPSPVQGAVSLAGATNFTALNRPDLLPEAFFPPEYAESRNATFHVTGNEPPMLLLEGLADEIDYPSQQTKLLEDAVRQAGGVVTAKYYPGVNHTSILYGLAKGAAHPQVLADTLSWLAAH